MPLILDLFKGFEVDYDAKHKIFYVNKPIPVKDFLYLKNLLSRVKEEIKDIRVYGDKLSKIRSILWVKRNWTNIII